MASGPRDLAADAGHAKLASALQHPDPDVRAKAIAVVVSLGESGATRLLQVMIHDPAPAVRAAAVAAAGRTRNVELAASLIVALADPDLEVRRAAVTAVSQLTGHPLTADDAESRVDPDEIQGLKQWWKQQRLAALRRETES